MPNAFNQLLGAMSGGFTGYGQEQDKKEADARRAQADARNAQNDEIQNALRIAQTKGALRSAAAPVEGSPEWVAMKRAGAGAEVEGATPGLVQREDAMRPGKVADATALIAPKVAEQGALTPGLVTRAGEVANAEVPAKVRVAQEGGRLSNTEATQFAKANKPLTDAVPAYAQAKGAFTEARAGNPAALKSALIAYAGVADPKAQLRQGIINMVSQVDPSVAGNFELAVNRLTSGTLPPRIIDDMEKMVDRIHGTQRALYDQRRSAMVGRMPTLDQYIPSTQETFDVPGMTAGAGAPTTGADPFAHIIPKKP
jgi:hypothetical protein